MQIESFKVFCDLVDSASFSKAAEINGVTQSAVSQQVRAIEERFHVRLIERGRRAFTLTPEGRAFLEASRDILGAFESLGNRIQKLQTTTVGELRIATIFSIGLHELPPCLKHFRREHPKVEVRVEYRRSTQVYTSVLEGRADVGLVAYPVTKRGLSVRVFRQDNLVLICPPGHRLALRKSAALTDLQGEKFIAFEPDLPTRREIDRKLRAAGVKVINLFEFDNVETVKRAVQNENAISIVPETAVRSEVEAGQLRALSLGAPGMQRPLGALVKRSASSTPALREFLSLLEKQDPTGE